MTCRDFSTRLHRTRWRGLLMWTGALLYFSTSAQTPNTYTFSTGTTGPNSTPATLVSPTTLVGAASDDGAGALTNIGFTFNFGGNNYTQFGAGANGVLRLGAVTTTGSAYYTNSLANANSGGAMIMPYWDDIATGTGGYVSYELQGTSPNQRLVVEWFVTVPRNTSGAANARFQCWLDETSNNITFVHATGTLANSAQSGYSIGINLATSQYISVNGATHANSTSTFTTTATATIGAGRWYQFAPPVACSGTPDPGTVPSSVAVCSGNTTVLTATGLTTGLGVSYQWEESPDGIGSWADVVGGSGATTASYTTTAITGTRYFRIKSTCSTGPDENFSNVVTVNVTAGQIDEDFSSGTLFGNCWSVSGTPGDEVQYSPASGYAVGTGSVLWDFFSAGVGEEHIFTSPVVTPLGSGLQLEFDVAGRSYTGGEVDQIFLEESSDGGSNWTVIQLMTNEVGDVLNTAGSATGELGDGGANPTAGEWASLAYPLSAGTNRIRFRGVSDFGNNVLIDNIAVTTAPLCSAPTATTSVVPNCGAGTYTVEVTVTGTGSGATVDLVSDVLGLEYAAVDGTNLGGNPYVMGPFTMDSPATLTMEHESDGACDVALGTFNYLSADCPTIVNCGSTTNETYCYVDNDLQDWSYSASAAFPLVLNFNSGYIENCCDRLRIYDGTDNSGTLLFDSFDSGFIGNDLTGVSATAASGNIFMDFDSDGSVDCADDGNGPWDWDVDCLTCTPPNVASVTVVPACPGGFGVDVQIDDFGSGSSATINYSVNSIAQTPIVVGTTGTTNLTGFSNGDDVDIVVAHDSDPACDVTFNNNTFNCPPANDDCGGAIALTVNPDFACGTVTAGTTAAATASVQPDVDSGTPDDDVWFSFVATATTHRVSLLNVSGFTDMGHSVYRALPDPCAPAGMTLINTSDPNESNPAGLTIGETYFVRVYAWGTGASNATFDICIGTPPPPPANDDCGGAIALTVNPDFACGTVTAGTTSSATASVQPDVDSGTPDDDVWYSFVATATTHRVSLLNVSGFADMGHSVYRALPDPCAPAGMTLINTSDPDVSNPAGLTIGETYFVRVYAWGTGASNVTFNICIGTQPPPPANDLCSDAIMMSCNSTVTGSTVNATHTGAPTAGCSDVVINDPYVYNAGGRGVWYTVQGFDGTMVASTCGSSFDTQVWVGTTADCVTLTCVAANDDAIGFCSPQSRATWTGSSSETYYIYVTGWATNSGTYSLSVICGDTNPACAANGLNLEFQNDANPGQVTWEILNSGNLVVLSGADPVPANSIGTQALCLPDGCYRLRVLDSGGDGMTTGGYELRTSSGDRIIDNTNNFSTGSVSAISGNQTFCLPLGTVSPIWSSCDKLDWVNNKFIVCHADAAVSAQFGVTNATSGYEFWFYDPNGSFSYRRFRSHATSDGYGSGATRACHFKVNGWFASMANPHLPANVLLNVRVRGRVAGVNQNFGPACQFKLDPALAACPRVKLQDDPANTSDYSCGVSRNFGGPSSPANRIYANPPQPIPVVASSSVRYQFRFRITGENVCIVRPPQTSARMVLNWTTGTPLECSKTYEVDVRVSLDGGATWCFGPAGSSEAAACADTEDWGKVCLVTINPCALPNGGGNSLVVQGDGEFTMYPNPNRGDQLFLNLSKVQEGVNTVNVDIYDLTGKRVAARTIAVQDGFVKTSLDLNGDLSGGMYMVNITAGDKTYTERLVIQP